LLFDVVNGRNADKVAHPTQKPVALCEYMIRTYTNEGETVLDNCMGSGTTGIACMNTGRNFIGIEKDPKYFEIARNRIMGHNVKLTGGARGGSNEETPLERRPVERRVGGNAP
jgi:methylase of polypeptide subunit release factors